jgi:LuxR family maltose regulon positive regulatory protein
LLREDVIPRRHLLDDLYSRLTSHPLTLLSAPAGYGKTTVLAALPQTYPDLAVAWLSLDEEDNDPARFLAALVASLRRLNPECGATALSLLADLSGAGLEARRVMSVLINDIQDALPDPFAMLLDDLHLIVEPSIYVALRYLLERIPPQMRLVAASRTDPPLALARMRARGEVAELHLVDLRFSSAETETFLNDNLGLDLAPEDLDSLHSRTEGWPAGLRLLAGSLGRIRAITDRDSFIRHFTQSKRYVFDFLAEEVLNHQEPDLRAFLLQTAILPELTPSLCLAVTGRADAQTVLDELSRRNLIMVVPGQDPLRTAGRDSSHAVTPPEPPPSFRYHALFAEFLRQRLQQEMPERVNRLHVLAARAERVRSRSIGHYLAAAKWHEAATVIEQVGHDALRQGLLDTLAGWINTLPDEILDAHPILLHYLGICAWQRGRLVAAQPLLERAQAGYERADMGAERSEATADLATCALLLADFAKSESLYDRALTDATPPQTRLRVLMDRSWIGILQGRWGQAQQDFDNAMAMTQGPLDPDVLKSLVYHLGPGLVVLPGGIDHIERICHLALAQVGEQISPMRAQIEGLMALIHGWRGRWLKALELGRQVVAIEKRLGGQPFIGHDAAAVVIAACGAIGNYALADAYFDLLFQGVRHMEFADLYVSAFLFVPGRVLWMQGRFAEASHSFWSRRTASLPLGAAHA